MKRKACQIVTSKKKSKNIHEREDATNESTPPILSGVKCYIHPANFGVKRLNIFQKLVEKYGGEIIKTLPCPNKGISHAVFEETVDIEKLKVLLDPSSFDNAIFVRCTWLVKCIKAKAKVETKDYEIISNPDPCEKHPKKEEFNISEYIKVKAPQMENVRNGGQLLLNHLEKDDNLCSKEFVVGKDLNPNNSSDVDETEIEEKKASLLVAQHEPDGQQSLGEKLKSQYQEAKTEEENQASSGLAGQTVTATYQDQESVKLLIKPFPKKLQEKFACAHSSSQMIDLNAHITAELEKLAEVYKSKNDTWRAHGYQKAIIAIRNHPKEITSREEALAIHGIGERLADKVAEIVESGKLRKVTEVCEGEEAETLKLFMGVWGAGPSTCQTWYAQGFRTLEDLLSKATLTRHQQIGLKHYGDINSRIPREEVAEIEEYVRSVALSIQKGLIVMVCGSYRRGKPNCGDVDILITHPDGHSHKNLFKLILNHLRETGFLTDDLVTQEVSGNQQKYLGVCKIPGEKRKHRRLDLIVVPYAEFAPAKMYFTGSAHFNRSMRLLATKKGMSLSEHGLRAGVVRQGREKLTDGCLLDTPTEESIFAHLGLEYRSPQERDH